MQTVRCFINIQVIIDKTNDNSTVDNAEINSQPTSLLMQANHFSAIMIEKLSSFLSIRF